MYLIDCHAHCLPPTILDALREFAAGSYLGRSLYADEGFSSLEKHLTLMDRFGVEKEVINYGNLLVPAARAGKLPMEEPSKPGALIIWYLDLLSRRRRAIPLWLMSGITCASRQ